MASSAAKLFKKCSPNNKIALCLGKREFIDTLTSVEPIDGLVSISDDYARANCKVFAQIICSFRYGREDDETMGLNFQKELILATQQVYPEQKVDINITKWQRSMMERAGPNAIPFVLEISPKTPASITLQQKAGDETQPCGIQYFVKVFVGESEHDRSNARATVAMGIFKVQYAQAKEGMRPCTIVRKDFCFSPGQLELEVNLEKQLYYHGDKIAVTINVRNNSNKFVKKICASVKQGVDVLLFQTGQLRNTIANMETTEGCPVEPGASLHKIIYLQPNLIANQNRESIAVEGNPKRRETTLASTTLVTSENARDAFGILVSYSVKVKAVLAELGGEVCAEIPFVFMRPRATLTKAASQDKADAAVPEKIIDL